jgi:hypothetical protein
MHVSCHIVTQTPQVAPGPPTASLHVLLTATADYERWLAQQTTLYQPDLDFKHAQMANPQQAFSFFRGTYYRWVQHWQKADATLTSAPVAPSIGDLHLENFGFWRDAEGRLVWGVNDFDEADELPYTQDLVRLAASLRLAKDAYGLAISIADGCRWILEGYETQSEQGGSPFVLEEDHPELRALAHQRLREPVEFWKKLQSSLKPPPDPPPAEAHQALIKALPSECSPPQIRIREHAGMGSLGKPRFVALVQFQGAFLAREAKALTLPATTWAQQQTESDKQRGKVILENCRRAPDPFYHFGDHWITRRLASRCSRIELPELKSVNELATLFRCMGAEAANIHLANPPAASAILADLKKRPSGWLKAAAAQLSDLITADWKIWQHEYKATKN